jgi:DNA-binding MarR family transcriptional regulator
LRFVTVDFASQVAQTKGTQMDLTADQQLVLDGRMIDYTRHEIAQETHLTLSQVDTIIDELIEMGWLQ